MEGQEWGNLFQNQTRRREEKKIFIWYLEPERMESCQMKSAVKLPVWTFVTTFVKSMCLYVFSASVRSRSAPPLRLAPCLGVYVSSMLPSITWLPCATTDSFSRVSNLHQQGNIPLLVRQQTVSQVTDGNLAAIIWLSRWQMTVSPSK